MIGGVADMLKWREQNFDQEQNLAGEKQESTVFY